MQITEWTSRKFSLSKNHTELWNLPNKQQKKAENANLHTNKKFVANLDQKVSQ